MRFLLIFLLIVVLHVDGRRSDVKILSLSDTNRILSSVCSRTCVGVEKIMPDGYSAWEPYHDGITQFYKKTVDIRDCDFVRTPVITFTVGGDVTDMAKWSTSVYRATYSRFTAFMGHVERNIYPSWDVKINWIAVGYVRCYSVEEDG